jgi:hypothetical protein
MIYLSLPLHQDMGILSRRYFSASGLVLMGYLAMSRFMATISLLTYFKFMKFMTSTIFRSCADGLVVI